MLKNTFTYWLTGCLFSLLSVGSAISQTISGVTFSPAEVCAGSTINVTFTTTGTFLAANKFSVELSAANGTFASKVVLDEDATSPATVTIPAGTAAGTGYKIRVVSTAPVKGDTAAANLVVNDPPAKPTVSNVEYCKGATASALTATGSGLKWYTVASGGTGSSTAPTPTTTATGTKSYYVTQTVNGCESERAKIDVTVNETAEPAVNNVEYCKGATASALTATGSGLKWYTVASGGTGSSTAPTPTTTATGTKSYYVTQTVNGCESERAKIDVVVNDPPAKPTVSNVEYCKGAMASALTATGSGLKWYTVASGGTGSSTAPTPTTTATGTKSYYVTQTINGCESERAKIDVTVNETAEPAVNNVEYCKGATASALTATGSGLKWYTVASGGTGSSTAPIPTTTVTGTKSYYVTQTVNGCESERAKIDVVVKQPGLPVVSSPTYCEGLDVPVLTATGTELKWYTSATGGTGSPNAPVPSNQESKTYFVTQTVNGCESARAELKVTINAIPAKPVTKDLATVCQETTVANTLLTGAVTKAANATLNWYTGLTGGTGSATTPAINTAEDGLNEYYVSQTLLGCESARSVVKMEVKALPAAPKVVSPVDYCHNEKGAVALTAEKSPTNTTLNWYTAATGGTASATAPVPVTTTVGNKNHYVSQVQTYTITGGSLKCESKRSTIVVTTNALPALPVTADLVECQTRTAESVTLTATTSPAANTLKWYEAATGGTGDTKAPVIDKSKVLQKSYFVTQVSAKNCESSTRKELKVRIKRLPGAPGVATVEKCQFDTPEPLTASTETGASLKWWGGSETGGTASATPPTPVFEKGESSNYFVSQVLEGCESDRAKIAVVVKTTPAPNVPTPNYTYCQNEASTTLTAQGQRLTWYFGSQSGPDAFAPPTANIGTVAYYVAQTGDNGCISPKTEIKVTVNPKPSALISGTQEIELGQTANIRIEFTGGGPWQYTLSDDTKGTAETSPLILQKTPQKTTSYSINAVENVCGVGTPNGTALVTVLIPAVNTGNPAVANICADKSFTIPFQASAISVDSYEYKLQISKDTEDGNFYSIPTSVTGANATGIIPDTTEGGDYYIRLIVESPYYVEPVKGSISQVTLTVKPLPVATVTGSKTILVGESAVIQVDFSGAGPWHFAMSDNEELTTTSITPYYKTVVPATTTTYKVISVQNECGNGMTKGEARIQVDPILGNEPQPAAGDWLRVFPVPVELHLTVQIEKSHLNGTVTISVMDMMGRPIRSQKTDNTVTEVDFAQLPGGIYFVKVDNGDLSAVTKVVKP